MDYDEFLLEVREHGDIEAKWKRPGHREIKQEGSLNSNKLHHRYIRYFVERLRQGDLDGDADGMELLGEDLYNALFPGAIGSLFEQAWQEVRDQDKRLRVCISVDPKCDEVKYWPLEFLRCPAQGGQWLATNKKHITLSRRINFDQRVIDESRNPPPLKVLVIISKPPTLRGVLTKVTVDIAKWATAQSEALARSNTLTGPPMRATKVVDRPLSIKVKLLGKVEDYERDDCLDYLDKPATYGNIGEEINEWSPHVLHFIGHGKFEETRGGFLALIPENSEPGTQEVDWINEKEFASLFDTWRPRLVVLQACESAQPSSATGAGFMGLAAHLVKRDIQAVVAMQFEIRNDYATDFAAGFYKALAQGVEIDAAVQEGRWTLAFAKGLRWTARHFGTPVLYMLKPDGIINPAPTGAWQIKGPPIGSQSALVGGTKQISDNTISLYKVKLSEEIGMAIQKGQLEYAKGMMQQFLAISEEEKSTLISSNMGLAQQQLHDQDPATPGSRIVKPESEYDYGKPE